MEVNLLNLIAYFNSWLVNPVDTQVALNPQTNGLEIPLGLLQSPVFQSVYPK